jgi:SAM-dependent methyltransferase
VDAERYFDGIVREYDRIFADDSVWSIAHRVGLRILDERLFEPPGEVADVGCGTGKWGRIFSKRGCNVTFTDISQKMVAEAVALAKNGIGPGHATGYSLSVDEMQALASNRFDLTLCMGDPLSYCKSHVNGIRELVRITRPGGLIFVSVDSRLGYLRIFKERYGYDLTEISQYLESGEIVGWEDLPIHTFTTTELASLFVEAGANAIGIWGLPIVSSYFLFDAAFQAELKKSAFMDAITEIEMTLAAEGHSPAGTHHLYGLFRKHD